MNKPEADLFPSFSMQPIVTRDQIQFRMIDAPYRQIMEVPDTCLMTYGRMTLFSISGQISVRSAFGLPGFHHMLPPLNRLLSIFWKKMSGSIMQK